MLWQYSMNYKETSINSKVEERGPRFYSSQEEQEQIRLIEAINRTDEEKFLFLMHLMKLQQSFKQGVIEHKK
jgi:hypothetical protein